MIQIGTFIAFVELPNFSDQVKVFLQSLNTAKPTIMIILHWFWALLVLPKITFFMTFGFASYKIVIFSSFPRAFGLKLFLVLLEIYE